MYRRLFRLLLLIAGLLLSFRQVQATISAPVCHGIRTAHVVALTFDACETRRPTGYDAAIVAVLRYTHTPATFFLGGKWMEDHPAVTRQLAANRLFEIGNHSYLHPHLCRLPETRIQEEIKRTQDTMQRLTGKQGRLFRAPYGEYNSRVVEIAKRLGLTMIQWEVASGDPDRHVTATKMIQSGTSQTRNGSIIIMHVNGRGWHTAQALPTIIARLQAKGYRFVTVSDLLRMKSHRLVR
jgi:peptidoglycan-N-acetylglucosamine deacetylase